MVDKLYKDLVLFVSNKYQNNSYLLINDKEALVIDPSFNDEEIIKYICNNKLTLVGILLTHSHYDHVGNASVLINKYQIPLFVYSKEKIVLEQHNMANGFNVMNFEIPSNVKYFDDLDLSIGSFKFKIIPTPGHTIGGICIQYNKYLFTGDTLFSDSVGRMDLPTGNPRQLLLSLKTLKELDQNLIAMCGHSKTNLTLSKISEINRMFKI